MGSWSLFLFAYFLGGITFIPLAIAVVLFHAHLTFPVRDEHDPRPPNDADNIVHSDDDTTDLRAAQKEEKDKSGAKHVFNPESEVAAGYFAVSREYKPMGINAKPIERSTPMGSTTVTAPSQSVYQSMYKSIFERKPGPDPLDENKVLNQRPKKAGNVFYVVLRHGHLMLFDDEEQLEVRHVVSLAHHDISIYSGGDNTPEGELFIKRNALCLTRRSDGKGATPDTMVSKPFYLFSENCSAKEDFYFSLLRNQEQAFGSQNIAPKPLRYDVKNIISLVQKLHSTEEHAHTRWLNAFIGRLFLGLHRTKDIENLITEKLTKKVSRVNRPSFLTQISIRKIETGDSAPYFTNLQLKNLNVEGETVMEADVKYTGNFRLEVSAVARIDLGTRLKARDITLVLAVVLKRLEGHILFKIKPPPSNRIWLSFQSMPRMEMAIEPIVSSRQITYGVILRQIENRIKEVVAETLVSPFWDDLPFFSTEHKKWRGGVFEGDDAVERSADAEEIAAQLGNVDDVVGEEVTPSVPKSPRESPDLLPMEKSHTVPNTDNSQSTGFWNLKFNSKKSATPGGSQSAASSPALDAKSSPNHGPDMPRVIRTGSFSASSPVVGTETAHADVFKSSSPPDREDALKAMANISARSPKQTPVESPAKPPPVQKMPSMSSTSSSEAIREEPELLLDAEAPPARRHTTTSAEIAGTDTNSTHSSNQSNKSVLGVVNGLGRGVFTRKDTASSANSMPAPGSTPDGKRNTLAAVSNAAKWSWNAIQRQGEKNQHGRKPSLSDPNMPVDLNQPMGRGQPLPPPGTPLPRPGEKVATMPLPIRRPVPSLQVSARRSSETLNNAKHERRRSNPPPPLSQVPGRRQTATANHSDDSIVDNVMIVEAPVDSAPPTPSQDTVSYVQPWIEDAEELDVGKSEDRPSSTAAPKNSYSVEKQAANANVEERHNSNNDSALASKPNVEVNNTEDEDGYTHWAEDDEAIGNSHEENDNERKTNAVESASAALEHAGAETTPSAAAVNASSSVQVSS